MSDDIKQAKRTALICGMSGQDGSYLAQLLLDKEVIFKEDLERILGVRPYIDRQTQIDEAETTAQIEKDRIDAAAQVATNDSENSNDVAEDQEENRETESNEPPSTEEN
jgi:hypothetical protein